MGIIIETVSIFILHNSCDKIKPINQSQSSGIHPSASIASFTFFCSLLSATRAGSFTVKTFHCCFMAVSFPILFFFFFPITYRYFGKRNVCVGVSTVPKFVKVRVNSRREYYTWAQIEGSVCGTLVSIICCMGLLGF